jgi:signal transduction histidine kinase
MVAALLLVAALVGMYFFWENRKSLDAAMRGRALTLARVLSALTVEDIITGNKHEIFKKIEAHLSRGDERTESDLLYLMIYDRDGDLLIGSSAMAVFFDSGSYFYTLPAGRSMMIGDVTLSKSARDADSPFFLSRDPGIYDLTVPIMTAAERVGFVRVGISNKELAKKSYDVMKQGAAVLLAILLVGTAFSQIIAIGITKPILRISDAAEQLGRQNWETSLPVTGKNEISKLSQAFNQMAVALKQREASLSIWNRDLFILHTAGLDLMESLDLETLVSKISARTEDLVRADTVALTMVDGTTGMLFYQGVSGTKARILKDREMPMEAGGVYNWLASYGTPLLIPDAHSDFRLDRELMKSMGIRCLMTVPLWSSNTMRGMLTALNKKGGASFDKHDLRLFTVFSSLAGAALQNSSLYTDLKRSMDELKSTQEQLVHSSKMAAIGELASNVAHEINNPLTSVLGYTSHLLKTLALPEEPKRVLGMMEQETLRVRKIIRNLLDFARQKPSWMQPSDLLVPIKESLALVQGMAEASSVRIHEDYPASPVMVNMNHNEMKQVFINIIYNALQAMPRGGSLWIRLALNDGKEAAVEIEDTGIGIPSENLKKIFEPFFSTKENGDGTGLGLSISYRIVQNHGGRIVVESTPERGTVFRVFLPLHQRTTPVQHLVRND